MAIARKPMCVHRAGLYPPYLRGPAICHQWNPGATRRRDRDGVGGGARRLWRLTMAAARQATLRLWGTMSNAAAPCSVPSPSRPLTVLSRSAPIALGRTLKIDRDDGFPGLALRVRRVGGRWWCEYGGGELVGAHGSGEGGDRPHVHCGAKDPQRPIGVAPSCVAWSGKLLSWGLGVGPKWQHPGYLGGIG